MNRNNVRLGVTM
jgi:hypothetical protein